MRVMTNKMPVVGKRYRNKEHRTIITVRSIKEGWITTKGFCKIQLSDFWKWFEELSDSNSQKTEEVQVSKKANLVGRALELLKHALKHSDSYTQETKPTYLWAKFNLITRSSQDLVDAIEVEKNISCCANCGNKLGVIACQSSFKLGSFCSAKCADFDPLKSEPKIDMKEERVEPVSIWKDVSELESMGYAPVGFKRFFRSGVIEIVQFNPNEYGGQCKDITNNEWSMLDSSAEYCALTDFINSFEQMQKRIERLERK